MKSIANAPFTHTISSTDTPSQESVLARTLSVIGPLLILAAALGLWFLSLKNVDLSRMSDFGLVSVLPLGYYVGLAVLTLNFLWVLRRPAPNQILLLLHLAALILIIHGTPQIVYGTLRYSWAWKHVGIVDYIQRHGSVDPNIQYLNAYHNWPGFFTLAAFFNQVAGLPSSLSYAGWGPVFFNLLDLGALLVIYKTLTIDRGWVWFSAWIFYLTNWIGQDYFSPQAMTYFLYLVLIAVVLRWYRVTKVPELAAVKRWLRSDRISRLYHSVVSHAIPESGPVSELSPRQRTAIMSFLILICIAIASSHQLTPLMAISALSLMVLLQVCSEPYLPILMGVITVSWITFMAVGFLDANLHWVVQTFGLFSHNVNANLLNLAKASPGQEWIAWIDRGLSGLVWMLGLFGFIRRYRSGHWELPAAILVAAPIPMLAVNSYGGEMLFRVYFFSLPFVSFFAASLLFPARSEAKITVKTPFLKPALLSFCLLAGFLFGYYGKERMYYYSQNEIDAAQYLLNNAPTGSIIVDGTWNWPKQYSNYELYDYYSIGNPGTDKAKIAADPVNKLIAIMDDAAPDSVIARQSGNFDYKKKADSGPIDTDDYPAAYFIVTRSQLAQVEMTGMMPAGDLDKIATALYRSKYFQVVYSNPDALILKLVDIPDGK